MVASAEHAEEENLDGMTEYENRFRDIDSKLDAIRSSFGAEEQQQQPIVGSTVVIENDDDNDDDNSTLDGSLSLNVGKLQATLAEKSAMEMKQIIETLQQQKDGGNMVDRNANDNESESATKNMTRATTAATDNVPTASQKYSTWTVLLIGVPTLLCIVLAWTLLSGSSTISTTSVSSSVMSTPEEPTIRFQQSYTRQICRTVNGQQYCESDQESQTSSSSGSRNPAAQQRQTVSYQRQQCQYINGESYCESYEETQSVN